MYDQRYLVAYYLKHKIHYKFQVWKILNALHDASAYV